MPVTRKKNTPVWKGPHEDGITFSLLSRFLCCRERFRLLVIEGLKPAPKFNHRIEYGNMWHLCEETYSMSETDATKKQPLFPGSKDKGPGRLERYANELVQKYPFDREQIEHWFNVCKIQFPLYINYWKTHPDQLVKKPVSQEEVFRVNYELPSGRVVVLRGKWDAIDLIGKGKSAKVYLQENKSKGDIDEQQLKRQVSYDLQTMLYAVAYLHSENKPDHPFGGVRYNVVRRPLSGGAGTIRQHKATKTKPAETKDEFYGRVREIIEGAPETYFMRWKIELTAGDVHAFQRQTLNPLLEQLCDWWEFVTTGDPWRESDNHRGRVPGDPPEAYGIHYLFPYGTYSSIIEGNTGDLDEYLVNGSELGLHRVNDLFPELQ